MNDALIDLNLAQKHLEHQSNPEDDFDDIEDNPQRVLGHGLEVSLFLLFFLLCFVGRCI